MPTPAMGKMVRFQEGGQLYAALISRGIDSPEAFAHLTVFGIQGISYRRAPYSEELKDGHWSWVPVKPTK